MPKLPTVSIILPFYQNTETLDEAIKCILDQTFKDFELVLVSNNADSKSVEIAKNWLAKDNRIVLVEEKKQGVVLASQKGFEVSRGQIVARTDADDTWHTQKLEKQMNILAQHPSVSLVATQANYGGVEEGFKDFVDWSNSICSEEAISLNRFVELPIINPTILFRREIADKNGFYEEGDFPEDYEMILRWLENGVKMDKVEEKLFNWNDSETRLTRQDNRYRKEAFYKVKAYYLDKWLRKHNPFYPKVAVWGGGRLSRKRASYLEEYGVKITHFYDIVPQKTSIKPCLDYRHIPTPGKEFIISYVANRGARLEIEQFLTQRGYRLGEHFILAA